MFAPHVFEGEAKSALAAGGTPELTLTPVNAIAVAVLFFRVTSFGVLVAPTGCVPKLRLVGDTANVGMRANFATNASEAPCNAPPEARGDRTGISVEDV
jgi:hypothetical protein